MIRTSPYLTLSPDVNRKDSPTEPEMLSPKLEWKIVFGRFWLRTFSIMSSLRPEGFLGLQVFAVPGERWGK